MHVVGQKSRQRQGTARPQNIDLSSRGDCIGRFIKVFMGCLFHGPPNDVDVLVEHRVENIILSNAIGGDFHPLNRRELIPDHFLHGLLQLRIPSITDLCGKTHHSRFAHPHCSAQACGRHKRHLVIVLQYIFCNQPLAL